MGFASHANSSIKSNRALLNKRKSYKEMRDTYGGLIEKDNLVFKELTPFEKKKIRDKIIAQAKRDRLQEIKIYLVSLFALSLVIVGLYVFFFD